MNRDVIETQVRAVLPLDGSFAVFLGNEEKTFVIYVDESVGSAISMFMRGVSKERPLTHDLLATVLLAFGAKVDRVIINNVQGSVFFARIIVSAENELHARKVIELDARPSDSLALALQQSAPIFVAKHVLDSVEDVTNTLAEIEKRSAEQTASEAAGETDETGEDDDDLEEIDPDDLDLEALEGLNLENIDEDEDDGKKGYDDGYGQGDDDDEGEEWKKGN
jgi:bifunctional DNase/RNase